MISDEEQKERISDYVDTEEGKRNASLFFFCATVGVILVSVGVGFLFGAAYGFLLVGAFLLASAILILRNIKRKGVRR